jgi:hypothetical protein
MNRIDRIRIVKSVKSVELVKVLRPSPAGAELRPVYYSGE